MKKVVVIIPVHKPALTQNELASLKQCYKILGSHPIRILAPEGMDMSVYKNAVPECVTTFIAPEWLSSIQQYNKLKISKYFYDLFKDYEYLLTYELDAWVFRDELLYWCDKGYDYIGAPWFEGWDSPKSLHEIGIGNSGFSLRNIKSAINILKRISRIKKIRKWWFKLKIQALITYENILPLFGIKITKSDNLKKVLWDYYEFNEDYFWCVIIPSLFSDFQIADVENARMFSFDVQPEYLFRLNGGHIPFGCHAWEKYEPEFWKNYIPELSK